MGKKKDKKNKRKKGIIPPVDRTGAPIQIGDVLQWGNGERMKVFSLTYYGDQLSGAGFSWTAEGEEDGEYSDNLGGSVIVWRETEK